MMMMVIFVQDTKEGTIISQEQDHFIIRSSVLYLIHEISFNLQTGSNPGNVIFLDPIETTKREAALLADKGVEIIILLSHCGLEIDK